MPASCAKPLALLAKPKRTLLPLVRNWACTLFLATSRPSTGSAVVIFSVDEQMEFMVDFLSILSVGLNGRFLLASGFWRAPGIGDMLVCALFVG
jgi:hypothetical protein